MKNQTIHHKFGPTHEAHHVRGPSWAIILWAHEAGAWHVQHLLPQQSSKICVPGHMFRQSGIGERMGWKNVPSHIGTKTNKLNYNNGGKYYKPFNNIILLSVLMTSARCTLSLWATLSPCLTLSNSLSLSLSSDSSTFYHSPSLFLTLSVRCMTAWYLSSTDI